MSLVTLAQVKTHLGLETTTRHDAELTLLIESATPVLEQWTGALLFRTVVETPRGAFLTQHPVVSITSALRDGQPVMGVNATSTGLLSGPWVSATVTYTVGQYATAPANVQRAALRWIAWSWRRDHGGSDTYQPGGTDATIPGPGVRGIEAELRQILSSEMTVVA